VDNKYFSLLDLNNLFVFFMIVTLLKIISDYIRNKLVIYINLKLNEQLLINTYKHIINLCLSPPDIFPPFSSINKL
jgi:ABC-type bacteriocin/lantibiotic exporter with double-glycine peptidase domain